MNSDHKRTDIVILHPSADGEYAGMALELKADNVKVTTKTGDWVADTHVREQAQCHKLLREKGYWAGFLIGYDEATRAIDRYFGALNTELMF